MKTKFSMIASLVLALAGYLVLAPNAGTPPVHPQAADHVPPPYVQVTSVTLEPSTIHRTNNPNVTTVVAQILLWGEAPPKPEAIVEVGTYSSDPPNSQLKYEDPTRTIPLRKGVTVVKFTAESTPKTLQGKIKVAVTLGGATKGINIKDSEPKDFLGELTVLDP